MPHWNFYQANINGHIASIYLDLDATKPVDVASFPKLCWLFIKLKVGRDDGLSHDDEFDDLAAYEDSLVDHLLGLPIVFVGRVTTHGMRQFYFYAKSEFDFEATLKGYINSQPSYQYQFGSKPDTEWNHYHSVLYPGEHGLEKIKDR